MRFVSLVGNTVAKVRRAVSQAVSIQEDDVSTSPQKLVETIRLLTVRINKLEATAVPEGVEFEVVVGSGGAKVELFHNVKGPIRWYVTSWMTAFGVAPPAGGATLAQDATSTDTNLVLRSYVAGRAIVRVEPSQSYVEYL